MTYQELVLLTTEFSLKRDAEGKRVATFKLQVPGVFVEPLMRTFDWGAIIELRKACAASTARPEDAMALGLALAEVLLPNEVRQVLIERTTQMQSDGKGLRLVLGLSGELHRLPWEFLAVNRAGGEATLHDFLALDKHISIVRRPATTLPVWEIATRPLAKVNALVALASPADQPALDIDREQATLKKILDQVPRLQPKMMPHAMADEIQHGTEEAFLFHFAGHGQLAPAPISAQPGKVEGQGVLLFENDSGFSAPIDAATLAVVLRDRGVRVAVLGACHSAERDDVNQWSGVAESLLKAGLGATVGMQFAVKDTSAIAFIGAFYRALLTGLTIDEAVAKGRIAISALQDVRGFGTPVLYLREGDGVVFPEIAALPAVAAEQAEVRQETETQRQKMVGTQIKIGKIDARHSQGMIVNNSGVVNQHYGDNISTGGGDFVKGNKSINTGGGNVFDGNFTIQGDLVGRDRIINNFNTSPVEADAVMSGANAEETARMKKLYEVLSGFWFSEDDLQDLCFRLNADWDNLSGETKKGKARAFVQFCFKEGKLDELFRLVREARPKLNL